MYACRYGNFELLKIFSKLGFKIDQNNVPSLLHLTCYSENMKIIRYLLNQINLSSMEITSLLRISAVLNKQEITLFFMVNGGLVIDDSVSPPQFLNLYPKKENEGVKLFDCRTGKESSGKELKIKNQKDNPRNIMLRIIPFAKKYKFDLVCRLMKDHKKTLKKNKYDKVIDFVSNTKVYYDKVLSMLSD